MNDQNRYTRYWQVAAAEGGRIGLLTCIECGSVVLVSEIEPLSALSSPEVHSRWHDAQKGAS